MMSENPQITRMQDSIVCRPAPMVRKPKAQVLGVIVDSAPLSIYEVKTARGKVAIKIEARTKKYIDKKELARILSKAFNFVYPNSTGAARSQRYYQKHHEEILARRRAKYAQRRKQS